jgi:hypothetical protein
MGGLYFSVNTLMSQVVMWGGILLYNDKNISNTKEDINGQLPIDKILNFGFYLSSTWLISISLILIKCKKGFRYTFFTTATSKSYKKIWWDYSLGKEMIDESAVADIFTFHPHVYKHFVKEVRDYLEKNWERWMVEKPKWFTKEFIESIPLSVLSKETRETYGSL